VFDTLNMHAEPSRLSPSFYQIPEAGSVEVVGHRVAPRYPAAAPATPIRRTTPSAASAKKAKAKPKGGTAPPPMPAPPAPPQNWEQLSHPHAPELPGYVPPPEKVASTALDDWSLVRMKDARAGNARADVKGEARADVKAGWVLSRMLLMSIPDEVAQYAEGHRITAYVALGEVKDKGRNEAKPNWLWTTASTGQLPYEFDSFRVFVWSTRRHRYETAHIERNVKGYYPVETQDVPGEDEKAFSLVLQDKDGTLYKRTYAFSGYRVRMVSKVPYQSAPALPEVRGVRNFDPDPVPPPAESTWRQKLTDLRRRWFGR
jgi:hypothetical protein